MKLPIKKKYFDMIKSGEKKVEYRDAHITFICEETNEILMREVKSARVEPRSNIPEKYTGIIEDENMVVFELV